LLKEDTVWDAGFWLALGSEQPNIPDDESQQGYPPCPSWYLGLLSHLPIGFHAFASQEQTKHEIGHECTHGKGC
jgi:hypothetical protein